MKNCQFCAEEIQNNGNDNSQLRMELTLEGNQFWYKYSVE
jgi:hypothetical protein